MRQTFRKLGVVHDFQHMRPSGGLSSLCAVDHLRAFDDLLRDVLYGCRMLRRSPAYSLVIIGVLAVGIAANVIAFSLFKAVALAPLAGVERSGSLLYVGARERGGNVVPLSYPDYVDIRDRAFPGLGASAVQSLILTHRGAQLVQTELVTGNYFDVLQVHAEAGRLIAPGDASRRGQQPVAVLSDGLWQRSFGGDPAVIGTTIRINDHPLTVIGVANATFRGALVGLATELFVPLTLNDLLAGNTELGERNDRWVLAFMRPQPSMTRVQLEREATRASSALAREYPIPTLGSRAAIVPIWQWPFGAQSLMLPAVSLLNVMAALLLVVVAANVGGLVLVRSLARSGEAAARLALGATRGRILRQLLIESLVLAAPATIVGFLLPRTLQSFLGAAAANVSMPLFFNTEPDHLVVGFTLMLAIVSALVYGLIPALRLSRVDPAAVLKEELASSGIRNSRARSLLVVSQIALALVLLVGTALILRTLEAAQRANAGFDPQHVTWASFDVRAGGHDEASGRMLYPRLLDAVRADPGVSAASLAAWLPLTLIDWMSWNLEPDSRRLRDDEAHAFAVNVVSDGYFQTLAIPIVAGREFDETDTATGDLHIVVNETCARRFWATPAAAIGRTMSSGDRHWKIVGVARDIKYARLDEAARPYIYVLESQAYRPNLTLQVRARDDATAVLTRIRAHAAALDPSLTILQSGRMTDTLRSATSIYETLARMLTLVGVLAVAIAALGVYGLVAYTVKQKAHDIGVRTALGATRTTIAGHFLRQGARLALLGGAIGVLASLGVARLMARFLFGVATTDLASFTVATIVVIGLALIASLVPAWRAANGSPSASLRHQ
ncbi:MAG TPA: ABC transporter permease [Vicinamibacterales bacterium]|nr:ABC transporter permease [Vicinamibacterales bacterium]